MLESKKVHFATINFVIEAYMAANRGFHSFFLYQGHMVPDSTKKGALCLSNIKCLAFVYHDVDNANGLTSDTEVRFEKATIGKHNSSCSINESAILTLVTRPTAFTRFNGSCD